MSDQANLMTPTLPPSMMATQAAAAIPLATHPAATNPLTTNPLTTNPLTTNPAGTTPLAASLRGLRFGVDDELQIRRTVLLAAAKLDDLQRQVSALSAELRKAGTRASP